MPIQPPKIVLRIGSHSEKEYFEKLAPALDGIMFGGNLLAVTPAATASLLHSLKNKRGGRQIPYFLDPMTYCFGVYVDSRGSVKSDLLPLKSEQFVKRGEPAKHLFVKTSYMQLAEQLGEPFVSAVNDGKSCSAIDLSNIGDVKLNQLCEGVANYQWEQVAKILSQEEMLREIALGTRPAAIFAPYFYIPASGIESGLRLASDLARRTAAIEQRAPVHSILCIAKEALAAETVPKVLDAMAGTGTAAIWLWIDGFDELSASLEQLRNFKTLVVGLAERMEVFNLHGGYFSLLLAHHGLSGISQGVGYGEKKDVRQVIGGAAPLVRYYVPPLRARYGIPQVESTLRNVGVTTHTEFFERVCGCQICRGVLSESLNLGAFGFSPQTEEQKRLRQTPSSAKMCRYHFLLNRLKEPSAIAASSAERMSEDLVQQSAEWVKSNLIRPDLHLDNAGNTYVDRWANVLVN